VNAAALWCKSNFSFLEGASHPDELCEEAARLGYGALALCDRDGVYGVVRAHVKARDLGLKLLVGSQVSVEDGSSIVLLAQDRAGYANLCQLISTGRLRSEKGSSVVSWSEVCERASGLFALWGGDESRLVRAEECDDVAGPVRDAFGDRLYALAARHRRAEEVRQEARLRERARRFRLPIAAGAEVLYHRQDRRRVQDLVTCIRHGTTISEAGRLLKPNAEHSLKSPHALAELFHDDLVAQANARDIGERCTFSMSDLTYRYPGERLPDGTTATQWLRHLTFEGARARYGACIPAPVVAQVERELALIDELDYGGYFLTIHDLVLFCEREKILCQGRGSAANSAVCYCLRITAVDPVRMELLFERFLSKERAEPPDIDLDIEHERREEVIQYMYAKYGRAHAAMVANLVCYRARSSVRDVGKALGWKESQLMRVAQLLSHWDGIEEGVFTQAGLDTSTRACRLLLELASEIEGFPRHLSIHPGGFLLGHEPVSTLVPIENATMRNRTVIQWDKDDVEALGLFKVDLLGLGALTHLHRAFDLLRENHGLELSIATIPPDDRATFEQISSADTVGVFQIESRAQMSMLPQLKPRTYYDLVIEISIVRPGPITGGMVHPFLRRRNGEEPVEYPHECLRPVLEKTLGVPLFQEQVMKLAVVAADYTPGEADSLRRDMAAWKKTGRIAQHRERLITRMQKKGIAIEFAERVFQQILGFGEYGFPESHAASFALISYAGAWIKRHHPAVFTCALLNAQPMGFYSVATIVEDAKRHGVEMRPVDVQRSRWDCSLETKDDVLSVRMGLRFVRNLGYGAGRAIETAAGASEFLSIDDFHRRTRIPESALKSLAEAGAFEALERERRSALWSAVGSSRAEANGMFTGEAHAEPTPRFAPLSEFDTIRWDYSATNYSARSHPLVPLRKELDALGLPDARRVSKMRDGARVDYAGLVICRQRPGTAAGVTFMTLEDETGFVNIIVKPAVFEAHALLGKTRAFLGVSGRLQVKGSSVQLLAKKLWVPEVDVEPQSGGSRDFH
jgi:error-prone DNA polymerase